VVGAPGASEQALTVITALEIQPVAGQRRKYHLVAADAAALAAAIDECRRFVDEMVAAPESATIDTGGSFRTSARNFVAKAVIAGRAVGEDQSEGNESTLGTLVNETVEAYNSLVQDYNRI